MKNNSKKMEEKQCFIDYLKFIAMLLIFNSHMDSLYPIAAMATGGAIGNTLFFFISGYTWEKSARNNKFGVWYINKVKRIFLPTILTNIIYCFLFADAKSNLFSIFIFPNKSWFCGTLILFAFFYYFIVKNKKILSYSIIACVLIYFLYYCTTIDLNTYSVESMKRGGLCRIMYYSICMLFGLLYKDKVNTVKISKKYKMICFSIISIVLIYADKYLMSKYTIIMNMQFLNQLFTLISIIIIFTTAKMFESKLSKHNKVNKIIRVLASYTWEFYLVQTLIIPLCINLYFPINVFGALVGSCIGAVTLKKIMEKIYRLLDQRSLKNS